MFGGSNAQEDVQPLLQAGMKVLDSSAVHGNPNIAISGEDNQLLTLTLAPNQSIVSQPGMMWCEEGINHEVSVGGLSSALTRMCCSDEDLFRVHWINQSHTPQKISLTSSQVVTVGGSDDTPGTSLVIPKRVVAINLDNHGNELVFSSGAFMAAMDPNLEFSVRRQTRNKGGGVVGKTLLGGQGLFLCTVQGRGLVFLNGAGTIVEKNLQAGETIIVDQNAVLAWASSVNFGYRIVHSMGMACCGGEGLANTTLEGPGFVILQSVTTPASQQANPLACLICCGMVVCMFLFFGSSFGGILLGEKEAEENEGPPSLMNEEEDGMGRRLLQNLTYEVGRRLLQNFTIFA